VTRCFFVVFGCACIAMVFDVRNMWECEGSGPRVSKRDRGRYAVGCCQNMRFMMVVLMLLYLVCGAGLMLQRRAVVWMAGTPYTVVVGRCIWTEQALSGCQ